MNILAIIVNVTGAFIFIFIFWKKLKEDFRSDAIFTSAFYVLIGILISFLLSLELFSKFWFWAGLIGIILGFALSYFRYHLKIYETIEAIVIGMLPWISAVFILDAIANQEIGSLIYGVLVASQIVIYILFDKHYKKFTWYKSGRVGFSGLSVLGIFFCVRSVIALTSITMLSFTGKSDAIASAVFAFLAFASVFNLAQKSSY
jgi:hypothetical protein